MMKYTYFCKKGGVGKTTVTGEHANYLASKGKKVLIVSIDDQNSIFEMFGKFSEVFAKENNYFENLILGECTLEDALTPLRDNLFAIKTLNTDMLSKKLTLERVFEKAFLNTLEQFSKFDYVFFDLPPSSNRTTELLLDYVDSIILIVELNKLGVNGFYNTLQYFVDSGIELEKIKYILPNGFSKHRAVPQVALEELDALIKENTPGAIVLPSMDEKSCIQAVQQRGISVFDKKAGNISSYMRGQKKLVSEKLTTIFRKIK